MRLGVGGCGIGKCTLKNAGERVGSWFLTETGILLPTNQHQHRSSHAPKDVLPLRICASYCAPCQPLLRAFSGWIRSPPLTVSNKECGECRDQRVRGQVFSHAVAAGGEKRLRIAVLGLTKSGGSAGINGYVAGSMYAKLEGANWVRAPLFYSYLYT